MRLSKQTKCTLLAALLIWNVLEGCSTNQSFRIISGTRESAVIPLTVDTSFNGLANSGRAYLQVSISERPMRLFLDIGHFSTIALKGEALDRIPAVFTGDRKSSNAFGFESRSRNYVLPSCRIGSLRLADIEGTELGPDSMAVDGCIGAAFFSRFNVLFDYPDRSLILLQDTNLPPSFRSRNWITVPFYLTNGNCISIEAIIAGKKRRLIWDSGAGFNVIHSDVVGDSSSSSEFVDVNDLDIGGHTFHDTRFAILPFAQPEADAILGHNFFLSHVIFLNNTEHTVSIAD